MSTSTIYGMYFMQEFSNFRPLQFRVYTPFPTKFRFDQKLENYMALAQGHKNNCEIKVTNFGAKMKSGHVFHCAFLSIGNGEIIASRGEYNIPTYIQRKLKSSKPRCAFPRASTSASRRTCVLSGEFFQCFTLEMLFKIERYYHHEMF